MFVLFCYETKNKQDISVLLWSLNSSTDIFLSIFTYFFFLCLSGQSSGGGRERAATVSLWGLQSLCLQHRPV